MRQHGCLKWPWQGHIRRLTAIFGKQAGPGQVLSASLVPAAPQMKIPWLYPYVSKPMGKERKYQHPLQNDGFVWAREGPVSASRVCKLHELGCLGWQIGCLRGHPSCAPLCLPSRGCRVCLSSPLQLAVGSMAPLSIATSRYSSASKHAHTAVCMSALVCVRSPLPIPGTPPCGRHILLERCLS